MPRQNAFTLIELSIVLVIIGLLVGGVLVGRDLIKAAELRSIISEKERFSTAVMTFSGKYAALPGDMANATNYWGAQDPTPATCVTTASTTALTCNGNGDGQIDYYSAPTGNLWEGLRVWQHLANAGLVAGRYDGLVHSQTSIPDVNVPRSRISSNSIWNIWYLGGRNDATYNWGPQMPATYLVISNITGPNPAYLNYWHNPILKSQDALNIDKKLDDGKPYTGTVSDMVSYTPNCTTNETASADYDISNQNIACLLFFKAF